MKELLKNKWIIGGTAFILGVGIGVGTSSSKVSIDEYNLVLEGKKELELKLEEAKPYFAMQDIEKEAMAKAVEDKAKEEEKAKIEEENKAKNGVTVFSDDKVDINFVKVDTNGVKFIVNNKTDKNLTFQASAVSINGFSVNDILMSDDVAPQSKGQILMKCDTASFDKEVSTVGGSISVIDFTNSNHYDVTFSNIEINN